MKRPWQIAIVFGACLAVLLAALGWATAKLLELDRAEQMARGQAQHEEAVRLALWRMDSALGPLIAEESTRPYFTYAAFYPTERAYDAMMNDAVQGEVLLPSPLLVETPSLTVVHFQVDAVGHLTSPQAPTGRLRELAERDLALTGAIDAAAGRLAAIGARLKREALRARLGDERAPGPARVAVVLPSDTPRQVVSAQRGHSIEPIQQQLWNQAEYNARADTVESLGKQRASNRVYTPPAADVRVGALKPVWVDDALLLIRRVHVGDEVLVQGCQLDWPAIRQVLRESIRDLLPEADVVPVAASLTAEFPAGQTTGGVIGARHLAALPVALEPGAALTAGDEAASPLRWSLLVGWVCVALATTAVGALLFGTLALSERRAAFVSAVTHELRTPLTTFRMYTELLADGLVQDPAKQKHYYDVLHTEARRLGHLVENVLAYARLDGGRAGARLETVSAGQLYERVKPRLEQRTQQAGVPLWFVASADDLAATLRVDVAAAEQILFNLVDNACKYAVPRGATEIQVEVARDGGALTYLRVRDDGPGVAPQEARRLFRPFHKSAHDAAHSAPGVGLGLALSRRLARSMGGDLRLDGAVNGACFVLSVPAA